jgi:hypothetical protein
MGKPLFPSVENRRDAHYLRLRQLSLEESVPHSIEKECPVHVDNHSALPTNIMVKTVLID